MKAARTADPWGDLRVESSAVQMELLMAVCWVGARVERTVVPKAWMTAAWTAVAMVENLVGCSVEKTAGHWVAPWVPRSAVQRAGWWVVWKVARWAV